MILQALGDPISRMENGRHVDKLKRIRSMVYLRNNSIFAMGSDRWERQILKNSKSLRRRFPGAVRH